MKGMKKGRNWNPEYSDRVTYICAAHARLQLTMWEGHIRDLTEGSGGEGRLLLLAVFFGECRFVPKPTWLASNRLRYDVSPTLKSCHDTSGP